MTQFFTFVLLFEFLKASVQFTVNFRSGNRLYNMKPSVSFLQKAINGTLAHIAIPNQQNILLLVVDHSLAKTVVDSRSSSDSGEVANN